MKKYQLLVAFCLLLLAGCSQKDEARVRIQALKERTPTFAEPVSIQTMDTTLAADGVSLTVMNNVFEGLFRLNENNEPVYGMANSYEVSGDGLVYTFTIRHDAYWSNGEPVTAHDFVYAWKKALHPKTLSPYAYMIANIKNGSRILDKNDVLYGKVDALGAAALDDKTLQVTLERPIPYFLHLTAFPVFFPQNEAFVRQMGEKYGRSDDALIYNGPFQLAHWQEERGWTYVKNEKYWDKEAVQLEKINFVVVKEPMTVLRLYETGKVDRASLTSEYVDLYRGRPDFQTIEYATVSFIRFNHQNEILQNRNIRKAIANGWDKEKLADVLFNNGTRPAYFLVPKNFVKNKLGQDFRGEEQFLKEGIKKAREYWQKGLYELGKETVTLELLTYDSENNLIVSQYLKNQLEKNLPGLTIVIKPQPYTQKLVLEKRLAYDLSLSGWGADYYDPLSFLEIFVSTNSHNDMAFKSTYFDLLIKKALESFPDEKKRWQLLHEAEAYLLEKEAAIIPMFQFGSAFLERPYIKNVIAHPYGPGKTFKWAYIL